MTCATHTHHRKLRRHGDERPVNLMRVCADCHQEIHANPAESYEMGWMVHSWDDPAEVPCEVVPR